MHLKPSGDDQAQAQMEHSSRNPFLLHVLILCPVLLLQPVNPLNNVTDNTILIYNRCPNKTDSSPKPSLLISRLFQEFISRASKSKFFETIVADDETALSGTFQCVNSLSPDECRSCVSKFAALSGDLCGQNMPARIQLSGCYVHYQEADEVDSTDDPSRPDYQLLHSSCSGRKIKKSNGFEEVKNAALAALESGVISGNGFCEMTYESVHALAQCGGSLGACDCGECIDSAVKIAEDECRYSISGEVYMDGCFISYDLYSNGGFGGDYSFGDNDIGDNSTKLVAIVVGGITALFLGLALCYSIRSCRKKKDDW